KKMIFLLFFILILSLPGTVLAADKSDKDGKLNWEIDRIIYQDKKNDSLQIESEKDMRFPALFRPETSEIINKVKKTNEKEISNLKSSLFDKKLETSNVLKETKESLFASDYVAPK